LIAEFTIMIFHSLTVIIIPSPAVEDPAVFAVGAGEGQGEGG
jgi:hypothetical protein